MFRNIKLGVKLEVGYLTRVPSNLLPFLQKSMEASVYPRRRCLEAMPAHLIFTAIARVLHRAKRPCMRALAAPAAPSCQSSVVMGGSHQQEDHK